LALLKGSPSRHKAMAANSVEMSQYFTNNFFIATSSFCYCKIFQPVWLALRYPCGLPEVAAFFSS
jgi:hypothetical protein